MSCLGSAWAGGEKNLIWVVDHPLHERHPGNNLARQIGASDIVEAPHGSGEGGFLLRGERNPGGICSFVVHGGVNPQQPNAGGCAHPRAVTQNLSVPRDAGLPRGSGSIAFGFQREASGHRSRGQAVAKAMPEHPPRSPAAKPRCLYRAYKNQELEKATTER